jgi:beta-galactosidase
VGLGRQLYADGKERLLGEFPWMVGWCGDLDLTGFRRPMSYYREIVFGLASGPYIAVLRPTDRPRANESTQWSWSDSASTWTWDVPPTTPMTVEVYADADEVELILNDVSVGRRAAGRESKFISTFEDVLYESGCLEAIAYHDGTEIKRSRLRSAVGPVMLNVEVDRAQIAAHPGDLAFVTIELRDTAGTLVTCSDRSVHVQVQGAAALQALGSARPVNDESFLSDRHRTFEGRALAAVRPTGPGPVTVTVSSGDEVVVRRILAG